MFSRETREKKITRLMLREEEKKEFSMHGAEGSVIYMSDFAAVFGKVRRQYIGNESIYQESLLGPHISRGNSKAYTHTRHLCVYVRVCMSRSNRANG